jgi:hypothetical protein
MSQYTVRADLVVEQSWRRRDYDVTMANLPAVVRQLLETDLFEKYMPTMTAASAELERQRVSDGEDEYDETDAATAAATATLLRTRTCCLVTSRIVYDAETQGNEVPTKRNTVTLSTLHHAILTNTTFRGVYYAFLMSHALKGKKKNTNVGASKNPIFSVIAHNNQAFVNRPANRHLSKAAFPVIYDKDTASAAPHWKLDRVIGPFIRKEEAIECCHGWVKKTRGTDSKHKRAPELTTHYATNLYSSQVPLRQPLEKHLLQVNAPLEYIVATHVMKTHCTTVVQEALASRAFDFEPRKKHVSSRTNHIQTTGHVKKKRTRTLAKTKKKTDVVAAPVVGKRKKPTPKKQSPIHVISKSRGTVRKPAATKNISRPQY